MHAVLYTIHITSINEHLKSNKTQTIDAHRKSS